MPSIPVPYTENWKTYFGSQTAPVNQDPKLIQPKITAVVFGGHDAEGTTVLMDYTGPANMSWSVPVGDDFPVTDPNFEALVFETPGIYKVYLYDTDHPDNRTSVVVHIQQDGLGLKWRDGGIPDNG